MKVLAVYKRKPHKFTLISKLARAISVPVIGPNTEDVKGEGYILNFGCSIPRKLPKGQVWLNDPITIKNAVLKTKTIKLLDSKGIPQIQTSTSYEEAEKWIQDGYRVFCRTTISTSKGKGIIIAKTIDELVDAKLFTREFVKTHEFRVHATTKTVLDYSMKKKMSSKKLKERNITFNESIRSRNSGWILAHSYILYFNNVCELGKAAIAATGLDFGAVDILAKINQGNLLAAVVCEVNSAPAIRKDFTRSAYAKFFSADLEGHI